MAIFSALASAILFGFEIFGSIEILLHHLKHSHWVNKIAIVNVVNIKLKVESQLKYSLMIKKRLKCFVSTKQSKVLL